MKIMTKKTKGIWMDHSTADLIDINKVEGIRSITSDFTCDTKEEALIKSEKGMHHKRQQMQEAYYKEISNEILKYDHVLLFGPTHAKTELLNFLKKDLHFKNVTIDIQSADNMTNYQKKAHVKRHFKNN
jgi:stalled ribosome rescue protein Dom34